MSQDEIEARIKANPVDGTVEEMREAFANLPTPGPSGIEEQRGGIRCRVFGTGQPVLWLHGGGYVLGSPETHARTAAWLAEEANAAVYVPNYRRAPEHRWPAMLEDAEAVLSSFDAPVPVIGDSAGGHLALNLALRHKDRVSALGLISPNTDRSGRSETRDSNTRSDLMNADDKDVELWRKAMPEVARNSLAASPLLADLSGLPPVWITAATDEVLLDDSLLLIRALGRAGVAVTAEIKCGLFHMWPLWPEELAEARDTLSSLAKFVSKA